tara:strand:+ start:1697 stop:2695 length:999 start_codon:yes stop_codon:yes gene_type:complete
MNPIKHLLNNIVELNSNKGNLKQGDEFIKNKMKFLFKPKIIEGMTTCQVLDNTYTDNTNYSIPPNNDNISVTENSAEIIARTKCVWDPIDSNVTKNPTNAIVECKSGNFVFKGCDPGDDLKKQKAVQAQIMDVWGEKRKKLGSKTEKNTKGENIKFEGKIYFKNAGGEYYLYENSVGENTFLPNHVDYSATCPKQTPKNSNKLIRYVEDSIDPTSGDTCKIYTDPVEQNIFAKLAEANRKYRELNGKIMDQQGSVENIFDKNKETILLSAKLNTYDKLVNESKYYTDKLKALNLSQDEFMKNITVLQLQYGAIGISTIILIYFMIKTMSNKQ